MFIIITGTLVEVLPARLNQIHLTDPIFSDSLEYYLADAGHFCIGSLLELLSYSLDYFVAGLSWYSKRRSPPCSARIPRPQIYRDRSAL